MIRELQAQGITLGAFVSAIDGPVVLAGHSYGGAVIGQAAAASNNVVGLVYLAAYSLDVDETLTSVAEPYAPPLLVKNGRPSPYDARGAAGGPDFSIDPATFRETFCADVSVDVAAVMAATQRPLAAAAVTERCTAAG